MALNQKRIHQIFKTRIDKAGTFWIEREPAKLGDFAGTVIVPATESMVYARRINGQVVQVYNNAVPNIPHLDVIIGRDKAQPAVWKVIEARIVHDTSQIPSFVTFHHGQHEYPAPDTVFVRRDQFTPLLVLPAGGFTIRLFGDVLPLPGKPLAYIPNQDIDVSAYAAGTDEAYWVRLDVDQDGNLIYTQGNVVDSFALLEFEPVPDAPDTAVAPICALAFYDGQSELRRDDEERTIVDLRAITSDVVPPGAILHDSDEKVTIANDDELFGADSEDDFAPVKWLWSTVRAWIIAFADLLYSAVGHTHTFDEVGLPGTQYRQFVYEVSGGDFAFVIDEEGNPVMALEDLE